jgi:two-component system sensor histidine kinase DegS
MRSAILGLDANGRQGIAAPSLEEQLSSGPAGPALRLSREVAERRRELAEARALLGELRGQSRKAAEAIEHSRIIRDRLRSNQGQLDPGQLHAAYERWLEGESQSMLFRERLAAAEQRAKDQESHLNALLAVAKELQSYHSAGASQEEGETFNLTSARSVLAILEDERMRIAREMHDGPAQSMSNLVLQAEICERLVDRDSDRLRVELEELKQSVRVTLQETRSFIFDLRPMTLDDLGLLATLRRYVQEYEQRHGIKVSFEFIGDETRYSSEIESAIFRIVQEALTNVYKHANAGSVEVALDLGRDCLGARVRDDGEGYDVDSVQTTMSSGFGTTSMRERAALLGAQLRIVSSPGQGTEVSVAVPVQEADRRFPT